MRLGSLCTGIGGLDLAVEQHFGATAAWHSEVEPAPSAVLERQWPDVPNLGDLTAVNWSRVEPVDIVSAGYPCQPFSTAGKRKGADDERHLWPYVLRAVRSVGARVLVAENVAGHLSLGFDEVLGDLAEAGFDAEWCVLRASDVGAPHGRARLFLVAADSSEQSGVDVCGGGRNPDRSSSGPRPRPVQQLGRPGPRIATDPHGAGCERLSQQHGTPSPRLDRASRRHPDRCRLEDGGRTRVGQDEPAVEWGKYEPAIRRWEHVLGRPVPHPVEDKGRLNPDFVEWMQGYPEGWVDELAHGPALKALGNAVVTQQALAALAELAPLREAAA